MPTYDYHCAACDADFEYFQSMRDDPLSECPHCRKTGKVKRVISAGAGIIFKGSGFYETDYRRASCEPKAEGGESSGDGGKTEGGSAKGEAKPVKHSSKNTSGSTD